MVSNGKLALSLFCRALVGVIWSLIVFILLGMFVEHPVGQALIAVVSIFFYLSFVYSGAWNQGFKDANYVKFGHIVENKNRGLLCGALAMIPNVIVALVYYIGRYAIGGLTFTYINVGTRLYFLPLLVPFDLWLESFPPLVAIAAVAMLPAAFLGYRLGYADLSILERLIYKNMGKRGQALSAKKRGKLK